MTSMIKDLDVISGTKWVGVGGSQTAIPKSLPNLRSEKIIENLAYGFNDDELEGILQDRPYVPTGKKPDDGGVPPLIEVSVSSESDRLTVAAKISVWGWNQSFTVGAGGFQTSIYHLFNKETLVHG